MGAAGTLMGAPKGGATGATPLEGEGNPAEGGSSRVSLNAIEKASYFGISKGYY